MGLLQRVTNIFKTKAEGDPIPGPWYLPVSGGVIPADWPLNYWQLGYNPQGYSRSAIVEACIGAYSQTVAMTPGNHWRSDGNGGRVRVTTSALARILRTPNEYQSISDFLLNAVRQLYSQGNAYALALRNSRYEIEELHLMDSRSCSAMIAPDTGDIFYSLAGNDVVDRFMGRNSGLMVPARDVLHLRLHTSRNILLGETPLEAAMGDLAASSAMSAQQVQFYLNQARPSAVLSTDMVLDKAQVETIRQRWDEQTKGARAGGTPILTAGLKPVGMPTMSAKDAELAEVMKISAQNIALAFRVPLQILGIGGSPFGSTEALMQSWLAGGLQFCLNHLEEAIGNKFGLAGQPEEYLEFDTAVLLRTAMRDRIDALARAVTGGIYSVNEAREFEGMSARPYGDEPRLQAQVVPLSASAQIPTMPSSPAAPAKPALPAPAKDSSNVRTITGRRLLQRANEIDRGRPSA
jgi:HK97 family phage portal protein